MIAKRKGDIVRWGPKEIAKPISIKDTGGKSDGCGWKAIELISGDLLQVWDSGLRVE